MAPIKRPTASTTEAATPPATIAVANWKQAAMAETFRALFRGKTKPIATPIPVPVSSAKATSGTQRARELPGSIHVSQKRAVA